MKKIILPILILIVCTSCTEVHYAYKNPVAPMAVADIKSSNFGVIILGDAISDIRDVIREDISRYQGKIPLITDIVISDNQAKSLKNDDFDELNRNNYKMRFILIVIQDKANIKKEHYSKMEGQEYTDEYMNTRKESKDREIYSTTISVKCKILLYDNKNRSFLAKSVETFSQKSENEISDWFHDDTLFGFVEDFLKEAEKDNPERYPEINQLDGYSIKEYFISFLKGIEK